MKLEYSSEKVRMQCTNIKAANKLFGGKGNMTTSLFARINALENAEHIKDIIVQPAFRFHNLKNKGGKDLQGFFAIDVKTIREPWRIILQPLNENKQPYVPCNIDEIAASVRL
ncbi:MAG: type II toxin-antitoxin system RelE/ParE family toxin [Clostridium sp.]|nr:type II toxin-antitoxin system RelE/ParE family toxin [Clostridium sp.]